jgi:hypothetical protein
VVADAVVVGSVSPYVVLTSGLSGRQSILPVIRVHIVVSRYGYRNTGSHTLYVLRKYCDTFGGLLSSCNTFESPAWDELTSDLNTLSVAYHNTLFSSSGPPADTLGFNQTRYVQLVNGTFQCVSVAMMLPPTSRRCLADAC